MELTYVTIVVLASMVFALAGMVGYLYWQQTRILQHVQSLSLVVSSHLRPPEMELEAEEEETKAEPEPEAEVEAEEEEEDDRVSVEEKIEKVDGPPDVDDLQSKTSVELRKLLTDKGIPYGKRDSKAILLTLLKASS
jgi:hypothetical protein